jgi:hypothetical protein
MTRRQQFLDSSKSDPAGIDRAIWHRCERPTICPPDRIDSMRKRGPAHPCAASAPETEVTTSVAAFRSTEIPASASWQKINKRHASIVGTCSDAEPVYATSSRVPRPAGQETPRAHALEAASTQRGAHSQGRPHTHLRRHHICGATTEWPVHRLTESMSRCLPCLSLSSPPESACSGLMYSSVPSTAPTRV